MTTPAPDAETTLATDLGFTRRPRGAEAQFAPGTIIAGRYRIASILGSGGMGEVYRADDTKLGQPVALKFLPARLAREPILLERLLDEVRLGRLITHPNVCRIYDIVEWQGAHFVAMEYVDGEDLARLLRRIGRLAHDKAVDIARDIAAGLMAAHAKGILHRDLKPANVMIDSHGDARLTDFGLALTTADDQEGVIAGTPAYISPEQLRGAPATVYSDLYALGLVMYELLTGRRAHSAGTFADRERELDSEIPAPSSFVRDLDPAVERVILRCLSNDPQQRPRSAREVIDSLPGGDPLAAAMAAGETPSPRIVAAAGAGGSLKPAVAWSLLALTALEIGFAFYIFRTRGLLAMLRPKSPEVLAERAATLRTEAGPPAQEFRSTGWERSLQQIAWIAGADGSPGRWERLAKGPAPMWFWVREEPAPLMRDGEELAPTMIDPPQVAPGASTIAVDPQGRLLSLTAVPQTSWKARPADWRALFAAAGFDFARFTPAVPRALPPAYADARGAWSGKHPDDGTPIRVEAAAWRGTPVFFRITAPWDDAPDKTSALPFAGKGGRAFGIAVSAALLVFATLGMLLAWRNLRQQRGDLQGAIRVAAVLFVLQLIAVIGFADHALSFTHELKIILQATARALLWAVGYSLVYLALEPYVRRRWPDRLIAWARLLSGNWRDPMVGRDVLIGLAAGLGHAALSVGPSAVYDITVRVGTMNMLRNPFAPFAWIAKQAHGGLVQGLMFMIALMILTMVLRRRALATVSIFVLVFGAFLFASTDPRMLPSFVAMSALLTFIVVRFGLLAIVVYSGVYAVLYNQLPAEVTWYTARGLVVPLFVAALAIWAFRTALGGQPPWHAALLED